MILMITLMIIQKQAFNQLIIIKKKIKYILILNHQNYQLYLQKKQQHPVMKMVQKNHHYPVMKIKQKTIKPLKNKRPKES